MPSCLRNLLLPVLALLPVSAALACIWDRDTLAAEAKGLPGILDTIAGNFARNPPAFYEMRLVRVAAEIAAKPQELALYDDAGAAADRLHRGDEALTWMEKKKAVLDRLPESDSKTEHLYRYHANLGTIQVHRWLRAGAKVEEIAQAEEARDHIAKAIEINPEAHFGREKYQLLAIEWIIERPWEAGEEAQRPGIDPSVFLPLPHGTHATQPTGELEKLGFPDAAEGISGLIVLGDAWGSPDVFRTLERVLAVEGHSSVSFAAGLRAKELREGGAPELVPAALAGGSAKLIESVAPLETWFTKARAEAEENHEERLAHMEPRLARGEHPDTHPEFWKGYREPDAIKPPSALSVQSPAALARSISRHLTTIFLSAIGLVLLGVALWFLIRRLQTDSDETG